LKSSPTRPRESMRRSRLDNSLVPISPIITDEPDRSTRRGATDSLGEDPLCALCVLRVRFRMSALTGMPSAPSASSAFVFRRVIMLLPARDR
jgi:hypothetical protein